MGKGGTLLWDVDDFLHTYSPSICLTNRSHLGVGTKEGPNKVQTNHGNGSKYLQVLKVHTTEHGSDGFHGINNTYKKES
jgi:hypothetical protein